MNGLMYLLQEAQAPTFDVAQFLGTAGPLGGAGVLLGFLAKIWLDTRKEKREDKKAGLEGEVGAVAAAREAVQLVREQMAEMRREIDMMKIEHANEVTHLRTRLTERDERIDKLEDKIRELETERDYFKRRGAAD